MGPLEVTGTYTQLDRDAVEVGGSKTLAIFVELHSATPGTGAATVNIMTGVLDSTNPFTSVSNGFVTLNSASIALPNTTSGVLQPVTFSALAEVVKVSITPNSYSGALRLSVYGFFTDT